MLARGALFGHRCFRMNNREGREPQSAARTGIAACAVETRSCDAGPSRVSLFTRASAYHIALTSALSHHAQHEHARPQRVPRRALAPTAHEVALTRRRATRTSRTSRTRARRPSPGGRRTPSEHGRCRLARTRAGADDVPSSQAARRDQNRIAQREFRQRKQQRVRRARGPAACAR
jgi:hypothetical protein